jgi:hypothetical protein
MVSTFPRKIRMDNGDQSIAGGIWAFIGSLLRKYDILKK